MNKSLNDCILSPLIIGSFRVGCKHLEISGSTAVITNFHLCSGGESIQMPDSKYSKIEDIIRIRRRRSKKLCVTTPCAHDLKLQKVAAYELMNASEKQGHERIKTSIVDLYLKIGFTMLSIYILHVQQA